MNMSYGELVYHRRAREAGLRLGAFTAAMLLAALVSLGLPFCGGRRCDGGPLDAGAHAERSAAPSVHLELGTPTDADPSDDFVMVRAQYAVSFNPVRHASNWAAWHLAAADFGSASRRRGRFLPDRAIPAAWLSPHHEDFTGSGFVRGHIVPSADRTSTEEDNAATFLLTNVLPQRHDVNEGPWRGLEAYCHALAAREGKELYIVAGGVFPREPVTIGRGISVPEAFYKIAVLLSPGQGARDVSPSTRVIAILVPNTDGVLHRPWVSYRTSVRAIERRTGYDFDRRVPVPIQDIIESRVDSGDASP